MSQNSTSRNAVKRTTIAYFERSENCRLPRHSFDPGHPQAETHCLMRTAVPRVPEAYGRVPKMPTGWKEPLEDTNGRTAEDQEKLDNFALHVLARYYPLVFDEPLNLPPAASLYDKVKRWWYETILPDGTSL